MFNTYCMFNSYCMFNIYCMFNTYCMYNTFLLFLLEKNTLKKTKKNREKPGKNPVTAITNP